MSARKKPVVKRLSVFLLLLLVLPSWARQDYDLPARKLSMRRIDRTTDAFGWVRISRTTLNLGAHNLQKDAYYAVFFVNGDKRLQLTNGEPLKTSDKGEAVFDAEVNEKVVDNWPSLILYYVSDQNPERVEPANLKPILECELK